MTNELGSQVCSKPSCVLALLASLVGMSVAAAEPASVVLEAVEAAPRTIGETDESDTPVDIPDAALRGAVEEALGKEPGEPINRAEMATLRGLTAEGVVRQLAGIEHAANLVVLSLLGNNRAGIADVTPLTGLTSLNKLDLRQNQIADVEPLAGMTRLNWLGLSSNAISDLTPLAGLTSLTYLALSSNNIADVSPLAGLRSLTVLELGWNNEIADLSPLSGMTSLTTLQLVYSAIEDVSPLSGLTSLTSLRLYGSAIEDLRPLSGLTSLTFLQLGQNQVADVEPLSGLTSLTYLDLGWNREIADVSPLSSLRSLTSLDLAGNAIEDVSPLAGLTSLTSLNLRYNFKVTDASPLSSLTSLRSLNLSANAIEDVSPLAGLKSLTSLHLRHNAITDVSPLSGLTSLRSLDLHNNNVADWGLSGMPSLTDLDVSANAITDVSLFSDLTSLRSLNLRGNYFVNLTPLSGMTSLRALYLGFNRTWDFTPLSRMTWLTTLSLKESGISDLRPLSGLTSLAFLDLRVNGISDVSPLVANDGLGQGDSVRLEYNRLGSSSRSTHIPALLERGVDVSYTELTALPEIRDDGLREAAEWALIYADDDDFALVRGLDASNRGVERLAGLEGATKLGYLHLDGNKITDIGPLAELRSLEVLTLAHNMVEDWTPLASMGPVYHLALDGNALHDVPPLPPGLRYLYMTDNSITDIGSLADFSLVELQLDGNSITSLAPLAGMNGLRYLHVSDNEVGDIAPLNFSSLREFHLCNNAVRDISPLLSGGELLTVDVRRNPLADDALAVLETLRERRVTVLAGETVPYFPAAGEGRQGFVRIVNRSDVDGHVFIEAVDDAGVRAGPVRLEVGARRAVQFNSTDLEHGNATKGLGSGVGTPATGDWRLSVISALDVEVLSYVRTEDGFVTAMHDVAADAMAPFFNPGSNENQRSILRVVNTEAEPAKWTTGGYDDGGKWHPMAGSLLVRPQHALTLTAHALENTHGVGDGHGKWRLRVRGFPWFAMSLLESPTGHLTNLSTAPVNATPLENGKTLHRLPLFPAAGSPRQGFARVINRSFTSSGEVVIEAVDDAGTRSGPVRLMLRPRQAAHFNSADLENGNAAKGLDGAVGVGEGDWRLEFTSVLDLMVLAYARTEDGFLTSLHDMAPREEDGALWIPFFNPGNNHNQVSHLRLMNWADAPAEATITGTDDAGRSPGDTVRVTIPARTARQFTAAELEAGSAEGLSGALGDGQGKWRLRVVTSDEVDAMSLLSLPTGHMTNLSTTPRFGPQQGYRR